MSAYGISHVCQCNCTLYYMQRGIYSSLGRLYCYEDELRQHRTSWQYLYCWPTCNFFFLLHSALKNRKENQSIFGLWCFRQNFHQCLAMESMKDDSMEPMKDGSMEPMKDGSMGPMKDGSMGPMKDLSMVNHRSFRMCRLHKLFF